MTQYLKYSGWGASESHYPRNSHNQLVEITRAKRMEEIRHGIRMLHLDIAGNLSTKVDIRKALEWSETVLIELRDLTLALENKSAIHCKPPDKSEEKKMSKEDQQSNLADKDKDVKKSQLTLGLDELPQLSLTAPESFDCSQFSDEVICDPEVVDDDVKEVARWVVNSRRRTEYNLVVSAKDVQCVEEFGKYLRFARRSKKWSREKLAQVSGLSKYTIAELENAALPLSQIDNFWVKSLTQALGDDGGMMYLLLNRFSDCDDHDVSKCINSLIAHVERLVIDESDS